jgi:type I restriction enzyme M protein
MQEKNYPFHHWKTLPHLDNLPDPDLLAMDIIDNLRSGIDSFEEIMGRINGK